MFYLLGIMLQSRALGLKSEEAPAMNRSFFYLLHEGRYSFGRG